MAQGDYKPFLEARDSVPDQAKPRIWLRIVITLLGLVIAFLAFGHFAGSSPEAQARRRDADVISDCRRQIGDSLTPPSAKEALRFMCSGLRDTYVRKYGSEP